MPAIRHARTDKVALVDNLSSQQLPPYCPVHRQPSVPACMNLSQRGGRMIGGSPARARYGMPTGLADR
jgi:hypothetical protein